MDDLHKLLGYCVLDLEGLKKHNVVMRLGFLGGSFDPIHQGHIQAALIAAEEARLERVFFLPTAQNWQKDPPLAGVGLRLGWVRRVAQSDPRLGCLELDLREGRIYAIETVERIRAMHPEAEIFWIVGGDQLANLHTWHRAEELAERVQFFVLRRENYPIGQPRLAKLRLSFAHRQPVSASSTHLRRAIAAGEEVGGLLPECIKEEVVHFYRGVSRLGREELPRGGPAL